MSIDETPVETPIDWTEDWTEGMLIAHCLDAKLSIEAEAKAFAAEVRRWTLRPLDIEELRRWDIAREIRSRRWSRRR